jgi:hypothetical protein
MGAAAAAALRGKGLQKISLGRQGSQDMNGIPALLCVSTSNDPVLVAYCYPPYRFPAPPVLLFKQSIIQCSHPAKRLLPLQAVSTIDGRMGKLVAVMLFPQVTKLGLRWSGVQLFPYLI